MSGDCRRSPRRRLSSEGRGEDVAQGVGLFGGVVAVSLGLVLEASAHAHDGYGGVGEAGEVALLQLAFADAGAVLVEGEVADVVDAVLDLKCPRLRASVSDGPARRAGREVRPWTVSSVVLPDLTTVRRRTIRNAWRRPGRSARSTWAGPRGTTASDNHILAGIRPASKLGPGMMVAATPTR